MGKESAQRQAERWRFQAENGRRDRIHKDELQIGIHHQHTITDAGQDGFQLAALSATVR